jgi:hypothetical protein
LVFRKQYNYYQNKTTASQPYQTRGISPASGEGGGPDLFGWDWNIAMQGDFNQKINAGTNLLLKLADGTVIKLPTTETSNPVIQALNGGAGTINVFTTYVPKYNVPKETVAQLAKSPITDFKIDVSDQRIKNPKVKDNQMEKIQDVFKCRNK